MATPAAAVSTSIGRIIVDADEPPDAVARRQAVAKLAAKQSAEQIVASMGDATRAAFAVKWDGRMETARWLSERSGIPVYRVLEVARLLGISNPPGAQPSSPAIHSAAVQREVLAAHAPRDLSDETLAARIAEDLGADDLPPEPPRTYVPFREEPPAMSSVNSATTVYTPPAASGTTGKACRMCGVWKPYSAFRHTPKSADGYAGHCRECFPGAAHRYQQEHGAAPAKPAPTRTPAPMPAPTPEPEPVAITVAPSVTGQPVAGIVPSDPAPAPLLSWAPLQALLEQLPEQRTWSSGERGRWLRAFEGVLDWLVVVEAAEEPGA